ncbi:MAG TPA: flavin reductase family protein [Terriglobales bacterium]|jgi:flavin reductase (DIM6/NTAB) family NADH-FMN oxidoreductase RutF|nr:flavin reductase family protein [Terriglobales bacterium]
MDVVPSQLSHRELYNILINAVVPRPIAWVSTVSASGRSNLAPFSFFNAVCAKPPLLAFATGMRAPHKSEAATDEAEGHPGVHIKDTLRNVRETREFVINVVTFELAEAMNLSSGEYDVSVDEFELAKIASAPSRAVRPRRVADSPVSFECKLYQILDFNQEAEGGSLVIGEIVSAHIDERCLKEGRLNRDALDLIGRMGGMQYTRTTERFEMVRPVVE